VIPAVVKVLAGWPVGWMSMDGWYWPAGYSFRNCQAGSPLTARWWVDLADQPAGPVYQAGHRRPADNKSAADSRRNSTRHRRNSRRNSRR